MNQAERPSNIDDVITSSVVSGGLEKILIDAGFYDIKIVNGQRYVIMKAGTMVSDILALGHGIKVIDTKGNPVPGNIRLGTGMKIVIDD